MPPINLVGDYGGGSMFLITGILAALFERQHSGQGQVVDAAMLEGSAYLMSTIHLFRNAGQWHPERGTNLLVSGAPFYRVYETSDKKYMAVGAIEPKFYQALVQALVQGLGLDIGQLPSSMDQSKWPELAKTFAQLFLSKTRAQWEVVFEPLDACVTPVLSVDEAAEHSHNLDRNTFVAVDGLMQPNIAPKFSRSAVEVDASAVLSGQHSREVLESIRLGKNEIEWLFAEGVIE